MYIYIYVHELQRKLSDWGFSAVTKPRSFRFGQSSDHPLIFSGARLYKAMDIYILWVYVYLNIYIYASTLLGFYSLGFPGYASLGQM